MKKILQNHRGLTLVEILVSIGIFAVVSIIVLENYTHFLDNYMLQKKKEEMQYAVVQGMSYLEKQIRMGRKIYPAGPTWINFEDQNEAPNSIRVENGELVHYVGANRVHKIFGSQYFQSIRFSRDYPLINIEANFMSSYKGREIPQQIKVTVFQRMEDPPINE